MIKNIIVISCCLLLLSCSDDELKVSSATKNVKNIEQAFDMPSLNRKRKLRLYLPPNYENSTERYPVLYMHDGQNLFDDATSFAGEWEVDESLNALYEKKGFSLIVVGIDNGGEKRMNELSPWENSKYGVAEGKQYMDFIVNIVKPYIDKNYRTLADRKNTAIMGSSMGGLISHHAIFEYPQIFSKAGIFSPSFWYSEAVFPFSQIKKLQSDSRLYFLVGSNEGYDMVEGMNKMVLSLKEQGLDQHLVIDRTVKDGEHNEVFWRSEFSDAITWLFKN